MAEDDVLEGGTPLEGTEQPDPVVDPAVDPAAPAEGESEEQETTEETEQPAPRRRTMLDDLRSERQARKEAERKAREYESFIANIASQQQQPQAPPQPQGPDPQLVELAETLGLYDTQGQPDIQAAERVARFTGHVAEQQVRRYVQPLAQSQAQQQASVVREGMAQHAATVGIGAEVVEQVASLIPDELLVQPNVAQLVLAVAGGLERMRGGTQGAQQPQQRPQPGRPAPLFTEPAGGRRPAPQTLSEPFRNVLANAGVTDKDLEGTLRNWKPGVPITLE
jgi:hypothetical protein